MASQPGPWEDFQSQPAGPRAVPQPLIPRTPAPRYPDEAARSTNQAAASAFDPARAAAEARKANADAQAAEDTRARHGLTADQYNALHSQYNSLGLLETGINEVESLYQQNYRGRRTTLGGWMPNVVNPTARQFEAASNRLMSAIAAAQGLSAQQQNTPTELRIRFGPMVPAATDDDATIEDKIGALRSLLNNQRHTLSEQLGLREHPGDVERDNAAAVGAGAPIGAAGDGRAPTGPSSPSDRLTVTDPNEGPRSQVILPADQLGGDTAETFTTEEDRRLRSGFAALVQSGASREQVQQWLSEMFPGATIPDAQWNAIEDARRQHHDITVTPGASGVRTPQERGFNAVFGRDSGSAGTAFVANALDSASLGAPGLFSEGYRNRLSDVRSQNPVASTAGAITGGFAAPFGGGATLAEQSLRGTGQGFIYGLNSSGGDLESALTGGGIGGLFPVAFRGARSALAAPFSTSIRDSAPYATRTAAEALDVPLMPADVGGGTTRRLTGWASQLPFSSTRVTNAFEATGNRSAAARDRIAAQIGEVQNAPEAIGETARRGALTYRETSRAAVNRAYQRAEELAGDTRVTPARAVEALDRHIAELGESPMGAPQELIDLRQRLAGDFTVRGLRSLRTRLRDDFGQRGLRGSDIERRAGDVVEALSEDITDDLVNSGRADAAAAYRAADDAHRARVSTIDQVIMPIIGRRGEKSGEQVVQALESAMRSDGVRTERFFNTIPSAERDSVRASFVARMGNANSGGQNAAGDAFSLSTYLTNYNRMQPRAREVVFGREGARAMDQLAQIASARRDAGAFANRSNTGGINASTATGMTLVAGLPAFLGTIGVQKAIGRVMTSPRLVRWLARAPSEPRAVGRWIGQLDAMARTETNPALSQGILGLRDAMRAVNDNAVMPAMGRAAASPNEGPDQQ